MHPSTLFTPPRQIPSHGIAVAVAAIAGVIAFVILSFFIDALHLSMARGEALRLSRGMDVAAAISSASQNPPVAAELLQMAHR